MTEIIYSPEADDDLVRVWHYSAENYGAAQADRYIATIRKRIVGLTTGRTASQKADHVAPGMRRALAERHAVFFREAEGAVVVVRVLHQGIDVGYVR